ncbi:hypothetical protein A2U01_0076460, partial [Trifolium medium]|nr:hypothetical protein [Trifolium medium]
MTARKEVMVAVEGSKAMDYAISVGKGVICHMIARRKATSVLVVASLGTRSMLVVRKCFASIVARKATRVQHAGNRR